MPVTPAPSRLLSVPMGVAGVLFVVVSALWTQSIVVPMVKPWGRIGPERRELLSARGALILDHFDKAAPGARYYQYSDTSRVSVFGVVEYARGYISVSRQTARFTRTKIRYAPLWLVFLPGAVWWGRRLILLKRRRSAAKAGHCRRCGYDLRASPQRCPECGSFERPAEGHPFAPRASRG